MNSLNLQQILNHINQSKKAIFIISIFFVSIGIIQIYFQPTIYEAKAVATFTTLKNTQALTSEDLIESISTTTFLKKISEDMQLIPNSQDWNSIKSCLQNVSVISKNKISLRIISPDKNKVLPLLIKLINSISALKNREFEDLKFSKEKNLALDIKILNKITDNIFDYPDKGISLQNEKYTYLADLALERRNYINDINILKKDIIDLAQWELNTTQISSELKIPSTEQILMKILMLIFCGTLLGILFTGIKELIKNPSTMRAENKRDN